MSTNHMFGILCKESSSAGGGHIRSVGGPTPVLLDGLASDVFSTETTSYTDSLRTAVPGHHLVFLFLW